MARRDSGMIYIYRVVISWSVAP